MTSISKIEYMHYSIKMQVCRYSLRDRMGIYKEEMLMILKNLYLSALQGRQNATLCHWSETCKCGFGLQFIQRHFKQKFCDAFICERIGNGVNTGKVKHNFLFPVQKWTEIGPDLGSKETCPHTVSVFGKLKHYHSLSNPGLSSKNNSLNSSAGSVL